MLAQVINWRFGRSVCAATNQAVILSVLVVLMVARGQARAESIEPIPILQPASVGVDPFGPLDAESDPFEVITSDSPVDAKAYVPERSQAETKQIEFQAPPAEAPAAEEGLPEPTGPAQPAANVKPPQDPCAVAVFKPLSELSIGIAQPTGQLPTDHAAACWDQLTQAPGSLAACRCWPVLCYQWDATCFCHRPLYFEEINAERYGYGCDYCLQPAASAAHFFATVPALPYCLAAECPGECVYTLGHYRPGSCPPLRWHWPPCDRLAALAAAGVYTGLIFAIP